MPALVCSAQNCVYNNAMYCSREDIRVGGANASALSGYVLRELSGEKNGKHEKFHGNALYGHQN